MNKDDIKEIKNIIDTALETHLGSVHEEISDLRTEVKKDLSELEGRLNGRTDRLDAKIDGVSERLGAFENNEIDKRLQLAVRVSASRSASGFPRPRDYSHPPSRTRSQKRLSSRQVKRRR